MVIKSHTLSIAVFKSSQARTRSQHPIRKKIFPPDKEYIEDIIGKARKIQTSCLKAVPVLKAQSNPHKEYTVAALICTIVLITLLIKSLSIAHNPSIANENKAEKCIQTVVQNAIPCRSGRASSRPSGSSTVPRIIAWNRPKV
jgi:hypothetical protein